MTWGPQFGAPPGCGGARRPEKRVTARSSAPQNRWTGLTLPMNSERNCSNTRTISISARQNRSTWSRSYDAWTSSSSNGIASGISTGIVQIDVDSPRSSSIAITSA